MLVLASGFNYYISQKKLYVNKIYNYIASGFIMLSLRTVQLQPD
jgi:hypothetical protein